MPYKPKKACHYSGCNKLTDGLYCKEHERLRNKEYEKYKRNPETRRRYGKAWKRIRDSYAKQHPFCERCLSLGIITPTQEVHHILPLAEGGTHERNNLMSLCSSCHSYIHAKRGDRWDGGRADQISSDSPKDNGALPS